MPRVAVLLMGPTGAGKTDLALRLVERLPLEIVSVDSALVYRGMDIGTAKPAAAVRARVPHHLVDIRDPAERYSAGDFVRDAGRAIGGIWARGRIPLLVGGTMLYFHALTEGIAELPEGDPDLRASIDAEAARVGWAALHEELRRIDPASATRIHANDPQRIQRALEVHRLTGATISELRTRRTAALADVRYLEFAVAPARRAELHTALAARFDAMMRAGLLDEVRHFYRRGDLTREHPSMRAVGYRQLWQHLDGVWPLNVAVDAAVAASRQLAKRQWTWLRRRAGARWLDPACGNARPTVADVVAAEIEALDSR